MDRNAASRSLHLHRLRHIAHFADVRLKGIDGQTRSKSFGGVCVVRLLTARNDNLWSRGCTHAALGKPLAHYGRQASDQRRQ